MFSNSLLIAMVNSHVMLSARLTCTDGEGDSGGAKTHSTPAIPDVEIGLDLRREVGERIRTPTLHRLVVIFPLFPIHHSVSQWGAIPGGEGGGFELVCFLPWIEFIRRDGES
jgi:hypothetical protein